MSKISSSIFTYPLCPKCFRLPYYQIYEKSPENLEINCSCNFNQVFSIKEFLILSEKIKNKIPKCEKFSEHSNINGACFCVQCQMIICAECSNSHKEWAFDHVLLNLDLNLTSGCKVHNNNKFEFFCSTCGTHLCKECAKLHQHQSLICLQEILDNKIYQQIDHKIEEAQDFAYNYLLDIKNKIIVNLKKEIVRVEKAFECNQKKNDYIIQFLKILSESYKTYSPNYFMYSNLLKNCHLKFEKIKNEINLENTSNENITNVVNYFNQSLIKVSENLSNFSLKLVKDLQYHDEQITQLCILENDNLISCSSDRKIKIFNLHKGYCELTIEPYSLIKNYYGHNNTISYVSLLSQKEIISSSFDNTIKIWLFNETNYFCKGTLIGHKLGVLKAIPINNSRIASCSMDATIKIWSTSPPYECLKTLEGHTEKINSIIEMKNKKYLVSGSSGEDSTIRFWNLVDYTCEHIINDVNCSYKNSLFEGDNEKIFSGFLGGLYIISGSEFIMEKIVKYDCLGCIMCFNKVDEVLICGCQYGDILMFDLLTQKFIGEKRKVHDSDIVSIIRVKNCFLITGGWDKYVKIWRY